MSLVITGLDYVLDSRNFYAKHDYDVIMDSFVIAIVFPCKNYEMYSCSANLHLYEELTNIHNGERITFTLCSCKQFSLAYMYYGMVSCLMEDIICRYVAIHI